MEKKFWIEKWENNQTRFHQSVYSSYLVKHWPQFAKNKGVVFVPLCGKSQDMMYLLNKGHNVIGVELYEPAVKDFFVHNELCFTQTTDSGFKIYTGDQITIYCGDIFELKSDWLNEIKYVYDRASLVALPEDICARYVEFMIEHFATSLYLLQTIEFDEIDSSPPFSKNEKVVTGYFTDNFNIDYVDFERFTGDDVQVKLGLVNYTQNNIFLMTPKNA